MTRKIKTYLNDWSYGKRTLHQMTYQWYYTQENSVETPWHCNLRIAQLLQRLDDVKVCDISPVVKFRNLCYDFSATINKKYLIKIPNKMWSITSHIMQNLFLEQKLQWDKSHHKGVRETKNHLNQTASRHNYFCTLVFLDSEYVCSIRWISNTSQMHI